MELLNELIAHAQHLMASHGTAGAVCAAGVAGLGLVALLKALYVLQHSLRFSYPEAVSLAASGSRRRLFGLLGSKSAFYEMLCSDAESALSALPLAYGHSCTLQLERRFYELGHTRLVILNSTEAVRDFTKSGTKSGEPLNIADRPRCALLALISRGYLGSFFRMFGPDLAEVRQASSAGLHALIGPKSSFDQTYAAEMKLLTDFLDADVITRDEAHVAQLAARFADVRLTATESGLLESAPVYLQQYGVNILVSIGLATRFAYSLDASAAVKLRIEEMSAVFATLNVAQLAEFRGLDGVWSGRATSAFLAERLDSLYGFLSGAIDAYAASYAPGVVRTVADLAISKQADKVKAASGQALPAHAAYSSEDILVQVFTLFMAGSVTSGFTLAWAFYYLAKHPECQERIWQEIGQVAPAGEAVATAQRAHMPYTDACISESIRLASTQPLIPRATTGTVRVADCTLPRGTAVLINVYGMHRNPDAWPQPEHFRPERWLDGEARADCFMPFGTAPRLCIGQVLAKNILFTAIVNMVRHCRFDYVADVQAGHTPRTLGQCGVMRRPHNYHLKITRRT